MISLVDAGPGVGKTRTLTHTYMHLKGLMATKLPATNEQEAVYDFVLSEFNRNANVAFFAYHNTAVDNLQLRLGKDVQVKTFHGWGMSNIIRKFGYQKLVNNRTEKHIETLFGVNIHSLKYPEKREWYAIKRILHYLKIEARLPTEDTLLYLQVKYPDLASYQIPDDWQEYTDALLTHSVIPDGEVEYADMVSMGKRVPRTKVVEGERVPFYELGLVDESQDISNSTYQLATRMCKHVLFVGDKNQAIGAYAGASEEMYDSIASKADAIFPMKITQRCPPLICDLANSVRAGGVVLGPNLEDTEHRTISRSSLPERLRGVDPRDCLFVCRTNAGIISLALFMHKQEIPFTIIDKELATEMVRYVKAFKAKSIQELGNKLSQAEARAYRCPNEMWRQICLDKIRAIQVLMNGQSSISRLFDHIKNVFRSDKKGYPGTTIHKAKGQEAINIFVVNPPIELACCMDHPIQREQEINLHFVALTRSCRNLYWVKPS